MKYDCVITSLPGMDKSKPAPGPSFLKGYLEPLGFKIKVIDGNQLDTLDNIHKEIAKYDLKEYWLDIGGVEEYKEAQGIYSAYFK